jgi:hypothetical protein
MLDTPSQPQTSPSINNKSRVFSVESLIESKPSPGDPALAKNVDDDTINKRQQPRPYSTQHKKNRSRTGGGHFLTSPGVDDNPGSLAFALVPGMFPGMFQPGHGYLGPFVNSSSPPGGAPMPAAMAGSPRPHQLTPPSLLDILAMQAFRRSHSVPCPAAKPGNLQQCIIVHTSGF